MKRFLFYLATTAVGVGGFFLILYGLLFLVPSSPAGPTRGNGWRVISGGMILVGTYALLNREQIPDFVPEWVKHFFVPIYTLFWFVVGGIIFILSWF